MENLTPQTFLILRSDLATFPLLVAKAPAWVRVQHNLLRAALGLMVQEPNRDRDCP